MATDESSGEEFLEKTGLKRKLTGPPRLLLGKSRSPGQDERQSRKHRRHNDDNTPPDTANDERRAELNQLMNSGSPETVPDATHQDGETCVDLQDEGLELSSDLEQNMKKMRRRSKAGATIRRIFSCVRRRKELGMKDGEENTHHGGQHHIQDKELLTFSGDSLKMKHDQDPVKMTRSRRFKVRMWRIFKKHSPKSKQMLEEHEARRCNETFIEISSETSRGSWCSGAAEPKAVHEQKGSNGIDEMTRIQEETRLDSQDLKNNVKEMISLNVQDDSNHHHPFESNFPCLTDEEDPKIQISEAMLTNPIKSNSNPEEPRMSSDDMLVDVLVENVNVFKCKPVIMIEHVHSSDEESDELFETTAPRHGTLSPLVTLNGSCYAFKTSDCRFSEIVLAQTALSLVRAAIHGAVEQLSAELQSCEMDQDHV